MGGPGSGGGRLGGGQKPKTAREKWLAGRPDSETPAPRPRADPLPPPATLTPAERDYWRTWAVHAAHAGTLTTATAYDFAVLVSLAVEADELLLARRAAGWDEDGLRLSSAYRQVVQRLEVKMRSFLLAPFGRPMPVDAPTGGGDGFTEFDTGDPPTH